MPDDLRPPYRIQFDNARDPYSARNALGITIGALSGVPTSRTITAGAGLTGGGDLSANRTIDVGAGTGITVNANDVALTVPVSVANGGTGSTTAGAAVIALGAQPLDADLTAIAALTGTNTIYYRSAADTWSPVVVGTGLAFSGGNLTATAPRSAFRAGMSADQLSWPAATPTSILFNVTAFNLGSNYNTGTQRWTPPAGYVQINAMAFANAQVANGEFHLLLYKNGALLFTARKFLTASGYDGVTLSLVDSCNGTDYYAMLGNFTAIGGSGGIVYSGYSSFSGHTI